MAGTRHELSQHASDMLKERKIDLQWMEKAIDNPEFVERDKAGKELEHRFACISEFGGRVLHVVVNANANPLRIVTVYFDRTKRRKP